MKRRRWLGALIALSLVLFPCEVLRAEAEYTVKAAYLYNFITLVKWPAAAFPSSESPVVVGVVGRDPFSGGLGALLKGQKAGARSIVVKQVRAGDFSALRSCNVIFVAATESTAEVIPAIKGLPVLVVGEAEDFAKNGGMIGFVVKNKKIKLEMNRDAAREARLTIPSDLLAIATIVN